MGTKAKPGKFDCYANALPDEPMFILLARDPGAAFAVEMWADRRENAINIGIKPKSDMAMVKEARDCARIMRAWREANDGKWRR